MGQKITIKGETQILQTLVDINAFDDWATPPMKRGGEQLYNRVKTNHHRTGSSYIPTYTLERSIDWDIVSSKNGVVVRVFSSGANQGFGS